MEKIVMSKSFVAQYLAFVKLWVQSLAPKERKRK